MLILTYFYQCPLVSSKFKNFKNDRNEPKILLGLNYGEGGRNADMGWKLDYYTLAQLAQN